MKKIILFGILSLVRLTIIAQFSLPVELSYLRQINSRNDKMLHRQNHHNAELVVDTLLLHPAPEDGARFLTALAHSYLISGDWSQAAFSVIRQRLLFPDAAVEAQATSILREACTEMNFSNKQLETLLFNTRKELYHNHQQAWAYAIRVAFELKQKALDPAIKHLALSYQSRYPDDNRPVIKQIRRVVRYHIPLKYRSGMLNREAQDEQAWIEGMNHKNAMVYLRKKVQWSAKHGSKRQAKENLEAYRNQKMNMGQSLYYLWKKTRLAF